MTTFKITIIVASILTVGFVIALNWAMGIDYTVDYPVFFPMGIAMVLGIATLSTWGGSIGAYLDDKEKLAQCMANHPAGKAL